MSAGDLESDSSTNDDSGILVDEKHRKSHTDVIDEDAEDSGKIEEADSGGPPIDRGWAWVVLGGCVFEIVVYGGMMRSFGVFFLQYQIRFNSNASETAVMSLIQNIILSTTALFIMTIGLQKFSSRTSVFMGGTATVAGYLITAFTTDIRVFYLAQGVLGGLGLALIHPPMLAIIGVYFKKHRGLANSIFTSGGSVGGLIFAPLVVKLFEEYGYTGALLIISGLLMNIWVAALLMRPIESYDRKVKTTKLKDEATEITEKDKLLIKDSNGRENTITKETVIDDVIIETENGGSKTVLNKPFPLARMQSFDPTVIPPRSLESPLLQRVRAHSVGRQRTNSENNRRYDSDNNLHHRSVHKDVTDAISKSQVAVYTGTEGIGGSFIDINISPMADSKEIISSTIIEENIDDDKNIGSCMKLKLGIQSVFNMVFDLSVLRNPVFLTFLLMAFSIISGVGLMPVYIPTHAKDVGISNEKIGLLISIMAVIDLIAKITMGVVADRELVRRSTILVVVTFILGTLSHLIRFVTSFPTMVVFVVIVGLCNGQYYSMYGVLMMDVIGPEKFKSSLGFGTLVHGTSIAVFFPIAGLLRDITGSYIASFHMIGGLSYLACVLAFIIPYVNTWKRKRDAKQKENLVDET